MNTARLARLVGRSLVGLVAAGLIAGVGAPVAQAATVTPAAHLQPYPTTYSVPDVSLSNVGSGMCLTIAGGTLADNNRPAVQYYCDTDTSRHWQIYGSGGSVQIKNIKTAKCLTIAGGTVSDNGHPAVQFNCDTDLSRRWKMLSAAGGTYQFQNAKTGKCLAVARSVNGQPVNIKVKNLPIVQDECDKRTTARWTMRIPADHSPDDPAPVPTGGGTGGDSELIGLINDARVHPEKYPPHGNTAGATMAACPSPFRESSVLAGIASTHNGYLATQPIAVVNTFPNMHKNADGKLAWDAGEPMDTAGYHSFRAEIVATGFPTAADALRFWMQDDAPSQWGHRNLILNCTIQEAGGAHLAGDSGGHYWTVDMRDR